MPPFSDAIMSDVNKKNNIKLIRHTLTIIHYHIPFIQQHHRHNDNISTNLFRINITKTIKEIKNNKKKY